LEHFPDTYLSGQFQDKFQIHFFHRDTEELKHKARAAVQACDKGQITREGYRSLASISHDLPHEWKVSVERKDITYEMTE
jgi:hypothetical protein